MTTNQTHAETPSQAEIDAAAKTCGDGCPGCAYCLRPSDAPPETPTRRYAHEIAPPVQPGDDNIAWKAIRFHAARAMAFWQTMTGLGDAGRGDGTWAIEPMIADFTAMRLIAALYQADPSSADETVRDLRQDLDAPQVVGPNIWEQLKACRIDPESIRCYVRDDVLPKERVAPAETPEAPAHEAALITKQRDEARAQLSSVWALIEGAERVGGVIPAATIRAALASPAGGEGK